MTNGSGRSGSNDFTVEFQPGEFDEPMEDTYETDNREGGEDDINRLNDQ